MNKKTENELIIEAYRIQDACNLSGVIFAFAQAMERLCEIAWEQNKGTDWKNTHPMSILYAHKITHLTKTSDLLGYPDRELVDRAWNLGAKLSYEANQNNLTN